MNEMNNGENNNQNIEQQNTNQNNVVEPAQPQYVQPEQPINNQVEPPKKNNALVIVLLLLVIGLAGFIVYDKCLKKEEVKEPQQKEEIDKPEEIKELEKNVDEGITIYQNGKIVNADLLKKITGKYTDMNTGKYILISENISEIELPDELTSNPVKNVVAVRLYSFAYWRHSENTDNALDQFVIEFCVKNDDDSIRNVVYFGAPIADGTYQLVDVERDIYYTK